MIKERRLCADLLKDSSTNKAIDDGETLTPRSTDGTGSQLSGLLTRSRRPVLRQALRARALGACPAAGNALYCPTS